MPLGPDPFYNSLLGKMKLLAKMNMKDAMPCTYHVLNKKQPVCMES